MDADNWDSQILRAYKTFGIARPDLSTEVFVPEELDRTHNDLPEDWQVRVLHAYQTFYPANTGTLDGADEFAWKWLDPDFLSEKAKGQFRDIKGRFRVMRGRLPSEGDKKDAVGVRRAPSIADVPEAPDAPPADFDNRRVYSNSYKASLGSLSEARTQLTPEKVEARQELHNEGIPNVPEKYDRPLLDEHILQTAEEAEKALVAAGMPRAQAHEYAMRGLVVTRDGRHFAWVPFDTSKIEEISDLSREHTQKVAKYAHLRSVYVGSSSLERKELLARLEGKPEWANLTEALRLSEKGKGETRFADGTTAQELSDKFEATIEKMVASSISVGTKNTLMKLQTAQYEMEVAQKKLERAMGRIDRENPGSVIKNPDGTLTLDPTRQKHIKETLDAAEWVDDNLPKKLQDMPTDIREKHLIVEVLTRQEIEKLELDNPETPRFTIASAFAHRGGNRISIITDNIQKKVDNANQAEGQEKVDAMAWNMPAFFDGNGSADMRTAIQYVIAHEMGHTYDVDAYMDTPGWAYNMSGQRKDLMKMVEAGGLGKYGMTTAGGKFGDLPIDNWQVWEGVAEAFAQMVLHDQFQPEDLRQPAVLEFMRLFGFL